MTDLYLAMAVMGTVAAVAGAAAVLRLYPSGERMIVAITLLLSGTFAFVWYSVGQLYWALWVPVSAAIVWTNFSPVMLAVAAGWTWRLPDRPRWRRALFASLLALVAVVALLWPLLGPFLRPPPPPEDQWYAGVAMQTAWANCSPAAAATLLTHEGIPASEGELVPLCLTDTEGTMTLGLYRGLKLKAQAVARDVEVVVRQGKEQLIAEDRWPILLLVQLPRSGVPDDAYEEQWGWVPGLGHAVVCLGRRPDGWFVIADPAMGRELWNEQDLEVLWHGEGLRITPRIAH